VREESRIILLIEDNDDDVVLFKRALFKANVANPFARLKDGAEAIEYFEKFNTPSQLPSVCFLDWHLPLRSGLEVLQVLNSKNLHVRFPIVVLTNEHDLKSIRESYGLGAHSFLTKPLDIEQFNNLTSNSRLLSRVPLPNGTHILRNR
jgi:two-component system response regulator